MIVIINVYKPLEIKMVEIGIVVSLTSLGACALQLRLEERQVLEFLCFDGGAKGND